MQKILIIEDNPDVRENLAEILELYGYRPLTAENGKVGVKVALEEVPDLIICDVMMPELDGFGVLNILQKRPQTADIPFVFLTAKSDKEDFRRGMNLGADDYLTKPFYKDDLLKIISTRIEKSQRLKNSFNGTPESWTAFVSEVRGYEELRNLGDDHHNKVYKSRELLFSEKDYPRFLYFVKSGKVKLFKSNEFGKEFIIHICKPGEFLGYTALLQGGSYNYAAEALEDSEISLIPKESFFQLIQANRDVSSHLIKILANNVVEKEEQLLHLAYDSIRKRVASALLQLQENELQNKEIVILRDDLARMVGTAKECVIRMLTEFRRDGYIDIKNGAIRIKNKNKLEKMPG